MTRVVASRCHGNVVGEHTCRVGPPRQLAPHVLEEPESVGAEVSNPHKVDHGVADGVDGEEVSREESVEGVGDSESVGLLLHHLVRAASGPKKP